MYLRFYIDPDTNQFHIYNHGVEEYEVEDVMHNALEDRAGRNGTREALGPDPRRSISTHRLCARTIIPQIDFLS